MPAHRDLLETAVAVMWGKYESTVLMGGTPPQRKFAYGEWSKADDKLATHDQVVKAKTNRQKAQSASGK